MALAHLINLHIGPYLSRISFQWYSSYLVFYTIEFWRVTQIQSMIGKKPDVVPALKMVPQRWLHASTGARYRSRNITK